MARSSREAQAGVNKEKQVARWVCRERHFRQREGSGLTMGVAQCRLRISGELSLAKMVCVGDF